MPSPKRESGRRRSCRLFHLAALFRCSRSAHRPDWSQWLFDLRTRSSLQGRAVRKKLNPGDVVVVDNFVLPPFIVAEMVGCSFFFALSGLFNGELVLRNKRTKMTQRMLVCSGLLLEKSYWPVKSVNTPRSLQCQVLLSIRLQGVKLSTSGEWTSLALCQFEEETPTYLIASVPSFDFNETPILACDALDISPRTYIVSTKTASPSY